ncbi:thiamine ABC transporter ATP-binding protein [Vibrio sp. AK197]
MLALDNVLYEYQNEHFCFDLRVNAGARVALLGPSGAGKSTLLALMAGFIEPSRGRIVANQRDVVGLPPYQRPFAMLFQEHNLFAHLSVFDNIALGLSPSLKLSIDQRQQVVDAAKQVGVSELMERLPEQLSGGQRQRVALARCFVQSHPIWLFDEPFSALDPILREDMLALVNKLAIEREITLVMVTHHLSDVKAIATDFAYIDQGHVEVSDKVGNLTEQHGNPRLQAFIRAGLGQL